MLAQQKTTALATRESQLATSLVSAVKQFNSLITQSVGEAAAWAQVLGQLADWCRKNGYSEAEIMALFNSQIKSPAEREAWINRLRQYGVLPSPAPSPPTLLQSEPELLQPRPLEIQDAHEHLYTKGKILAEVARTHRSILWTAGSDSGKTTGMAALIYSIHCLHPRAKFAVLDMQSSSWMGLERYPEIVTYCCGDDDEIVQQAGEAVRSLHKEMRDRYEAGQDLRRRGRKAPDYEPYWLFLNEWNVLYSAYQGASAAARKEYKIDSWLRQIIFSGRSVGVRCCLSVQDHRKDSCGFSSVVLSSMTLLGSGMVHPDGNGSYSSLERLIKDHLLFPSQSVRTKLRQAYAEGIRRGVPLIATDSMGLPRVGIYDDYSGFQRKDLLETYPREHLPAQSPLEFKI